MGSFLVQTEGAALLNEVSDLAGAGHVIWLIHVQKSARATQFVGLFGLHRKEGDSNRRGKCVQTRYQDT